jgi:hypothetical protein
LARYRLRYQSTDLEMPLGDFVIGRSSECSLAVDDPLVSRRHAVLRVTSEGVVAEDLGSRNGISVNGERAAGPRKLQHRDRVTIGSQEVVLLEVGQRDRDRRPTGVMVVCGACHLPFPSDDGRCPHCGVPAQGEAAGRQTMELHAPPLAAPVTPPHPEEEDTRRVSAFQLLAGIADKALALGRPDDAERILANLLGEFLQKAQAGRPAAEDSMRDAVRYALRLADVTAKARWVDWVFQIHLTTSRLMSAETIDALYALVRKVKHPGGRAITDYVQAMQNKGDAFSPRERFLLQRLAGLERVVGA